MIQVKFLTKKTYATRDSAIKAIEKKFISPLAADLRYFIHQNEQGRYLPVFIGEAAVQAGVHFHFSVVA